MKRIDRTRIHHFNLFYYILKPILGFWFRWFYRRFEVAGTRNIPGNQPVIFAANHQNALMDALAILFSRPKSIVFLARADIFNSPLQARILHFLKIMPVFRIRDGAENLGKNDETFESALRVLSDNHPLCLMPEGNHGDKRRLRPLVKGIFRIAFQTQEELGESRRVQIVPVGIDYEHYQHFGKNLFVQFGKPIEVAEYLPAYNENKARGMNLLRDRLAEELKKLMIHIESDEYYDVFQELRLIYTPYLVRRKEVGGSLSEQIASNQEMIEKLAGFAEKDPEGFRAFAEKVRQFSMLVKNSKLRYWIFAKQPFGFLNIIGRLLTMILGFPIFFPVLLVNFLPFLYPAYFFKKKKIKDAQFYSSFAYVLGLLIFNFWFWLLFIPVAIFSSAWWIKWLYLLLIPYYSLAGYRYFVWVRKSLGAMRFIRKMKNQDEDVISALHLWDELIGKMNSLYHTL